jgi:hypothetical protein
MGPDRACRLNKLQSVSKYRAACRSRNGTMLVAVSPFRLGELPNVRLE